MSSDRYACAGCEKYFHELDLSKDKDGNLLCASCSHAYDAGRVPAKAEMCCDCGAAEVDPPPRCDACWGKDFQERHKSAALEPDSSHYKHTSIDPLQYVEAMGDAEYRGACILNIVKYITRYPHKGTPMEDLLKAQDYVGRLIEHQKKKEHQP